MWNCLTFWDMILRQSNVLYKNQTQIYAVDKIKFTQWTYSNLHNTVIYNENKLLV